MVTVATAVHLRKGLGTEERLVLNGENVGVP